MYADIVVPVARGPFTFRIGEEAAGICPGMGIEVRLGARKRYMGIVWRLYDRPPGFATKTAGRLMGDAPLLLRHRWSCGSGWRSIICVRSVM